MEHFDVLIVGAGLSGVCAAHHLTTRCPSKSYVILEQREQIGGTWDLFRYPGVRSDSDMSIMCYPFRPWTDAKAIASGREIREYIVATARDGGTEGKIRFRHRIGSVSWSSSDAKWTVCAARKLPDGSEEPVTLTCGFLLCCAGYYRYSSGYTPEFPDVERFAGRIVHPQAWPEDLDYAGKQIVVIGSGATAVTLTPALAKTAAHVTLLQRSPGYLIAMPEQNATAARLRPFLPAKWVFWIRRCENVALSIGIYQLSRWVPKYLKAGLLKGVRKALGPDYDVSADFTPRYNPWDQRLCLTPDGDLFQALKSGRASVVTDHIESFAESGVRLKSGRLLEADIIVTATGLFLEPFGGIGLFVDGQYIDPGRSVTYKGVMLAGVPNFAAVFGYVNNAWTLRANLICDYVCRLLNAMDRKGARQVVPKPGDITEFRPLVENFSSGYVQRAAPYWPRQGNKRPWRVYQNYIRDTISLRWSPVVNRALEFSPSPGGVPKQSPPDLASGG